MTHICAPLPPPHPHSAPPRSLHRFSPPPAARGARAPDFIHATCETAVGAIFIRHYYVMSCTAARRRLSELPARRLMRNSCRAIHSLGGSGRQRVHDVPRPTDHFVYAPTLEPLNTAFTLYNRLYNRLSSRLYDRLQSVNGRLLTSLSLSRSLQLFSPICSSKANSHRQARHDKNCLVCVASA